MSRDRGPVLKRARALGIEPQYLGVNKKSKRHGAVRRRKQSQYGVQLNEKQKVRFTYGLSETQFRNLFDKASKRAGGAGENLLIMLEERLDNVVYRMGLAMTRREARQLVVHAHFTVNGKKVNIPSYQVKPGDVIKVKAKSASSPKFQEIKDMTVGVPEWLSVDREKLEGTVLADPTRDQIDTPVEEHLIVELYSK